ncbi:DDE-type integrase/transposase/recombinase [Photobacterium profundum]|uniref:Integrase catalytic domain-containing protein n=1 Tax=Photobacterium profundum (strain SS9) TaxID=298386 RepID=Q6LRP4_PHOPR|nr:DDE-type integrase/transposase/recombinase [Photobacterium profundum]CAG20032.1 Hypothetical protein PBPRA1621 [Photobacterium profundum SS9]
MKWKAKGYKGKGKGSYPSVTTFYVIKDRMLFDEDILEGQIGRSAAQKAKRMALKKYITHHILERVEIDSMYISDGLVDDEFRYLGPMVLTAAIDVHSRVLLGVSLEVGRKGESTEHIVDCIRNATLPKQGNQSIPEQYRDEWPMYGKPSQIIADAGSGYTSESFTRLLALLDISRDTTKVRQPWKKPHIERFFGTMRKSFLQQLPGYISASRYANDLESDETLEKSATLTVSQFKELLYHYILKDYHHKPHRGLNGDTPFEAWQKGAGFSGMSPPESAHLIRMTYPRVVNVTLDPVKGVQYQYLKYHSDKLRQLHRNMKKPSDCKHPKIDIYISHSDMSHVVVSDPFNDEFLLIPCTNELVLEGMSLGETKYINGTIPSEKHHEPTNYQERTKQLSDDKKARDKKAKKERKKRPVNPPIGVEDTQAEIDELLDARNMNVHRDAFEDVRENSWDNEE